VLTWTRPARDRLSEAAAAGDYRVVLAGIGSQTQSAGADGGVSLSDPSPGQSALRVSRNKMPSLTPVSRSSG